MKAVFYFLYTMNFIAILISQEMIDEAKRMIPQTKVERTIASTIDTMTGHLGEFIFAQYMFGDWRKNLVGKNKGQSDFGDFEIKTSAFPLNHRLNLLVREDYARKRKPKFYVQVIIDVPSAKANDIHVGTLAYICGYATAEDVDAAPLKDFGSKLSAEAGGYKCHYISIGRLNPIQALKLDKKSPMDNLH